MKRTGAKYFLAEGVRGIFLHGFMSFAAVGVIIACLIIMGSFTLIAVNIDKAIKDQESKHVLKVFLDENLSEEDAESVGSYIGGKLDWNVKKCEFISKKQALIDYSESVDESQKYLLAGLDDERNPLRHRCNVTLMDITRADETVELIKGVAGVAEVKADKLIVKGLMTASNVVRTVSVILIAVLLGVSLFIISNTIKLATFDRREEIGIMRIVGATKGFIRWPFVVEGFLLGTVAALLAFVFQWMLYGWAIGNPLLSSFASTIIPFTDMFLPMLLVFVGTGFAVGVGGSVLTIRKFLRV